ncbi:Uncharacterised protein [Serratia ficaria]|nr:Uncharacterised protein [Serratia ficaria]
MGVGGGEVQVLRDDAVLERQHGLDQPSDPGGGLGMADVAFYRAEDNRLGGIAALGQHRAEGLNLNGVAEAGAGAVTLDVADVGGPDAGLLQGGPHHRLLCRAARYRQPLGMAVMVDGAAADHRRDGVAVAQRIAQPLKHHHPAAFRPARAIGLCGECFTVPVASQPAQMVKTDKHTRG